MQTSPVLTGTGDVFRRDYGAFRSFWQYWVQSLSARRQYFKRHKTWVLKVNKPMHPLRRKQEYNFAVLNPIWDYGQNCVDRLYKK